MKVLSLRLKPYGPFTNNLLDFGDGQETFHLVYGPNEAGKTATLRALSALLFGIPERTTDDFMHEGKKLRIGACIKHSDGTILTFQRRKGRSKTLLTEDERELSESQLDKFLGGIDESAFGLMFGFGHEDLVRGGKEIASGKGDVGQSLFAAGSGISGLQKVLQGLENEAAELFKPRASNPVINQAIARYKDAKKEVKDLGLPSSWWVEHKEMLKTAESKKEQVKESLDALQAKLNRLERIQQALPVIGERRETLSQKEQLGDVLILPESFQADRIEVSRALALARAEETRAGQHMEDLKAKIDGMTISEELINQRSVIEDIFVRLGSYQKEMKDLPVLKERHITSRTEAESLLSDLRPGASLSDATMLRIGATKRQHILSLVTQHKGLEEKRNGISEQIESITSKKIAAENELREAGEPVDIGRLKKIAADIQREGEIEKTLEKAVIDLKRAEESVQKGLSRLSLWKGTIEEIEALSVPLPETVDRYEADLDRIDKNLTQIETTIKGKAEEIEQIARDMAALDIAGNVPTEADLEEARLRRDEGWGLVKDEWIEKKPGKDKAKAYNAELPLDQAYEKSVIEADQIADRLRRESDRVSKKAIWLANRDYLMEDIKSLETQKKETFAEKESLLKEWNGLWNSLGFNPLTPREMRSWIQSQQKLAKEAENIRALRTETGRLEERISANRSSLVESLRALGCEVSAKQTLSEVIDESLVVINQNDNLERARAELRRSVKEFGDQLAGARKSEEKVKAEIEEWRAKWENEMAEIGLTIDTDPSEAAEFVTRSQDLIAKIDNAQELDKRITAIKNNMIAFENNVRQLTERIAPDLSAFPAEQAVSELHSRLNKAVEDNATRTSLNKELSASARDLEHAKDEIAKTEMRVQALLKEARCENFEQIQEAERKSELALSLSNTLEQLGKQLLAHSAGMKIEQFIEEAQETDPDSLPNNIRDVQKEIESLQEEKSQFEQTIGAETSLLKQADGTSTAAVAAERAQDAASQIEEYTERYIKMRLAAAILKNEIERYRVCNQGPVLERASQIFSALTLGSFSRLKTTFDEKDAQILVGVRKDAEEDVRVDGMSEGTCDQLYLALRLASLERYLESNEPMPLIVDDVLVNFDDERTAACLKVLAEISKRTQMIYFTHHKHIIDLAKKVMPAGVLMVNDLK